MSAGFLAAMPQERSIVAAIPDAIQQKWLVRSASRPLLMRTVYSMRSFSLMEAMGSPLLWLVGSAGLFRHRRIIGRGHPSHEPRGVTGPRPWGRIVTGLAEAKAVLCGRKPLHESRLGATVYGGTTVAQPCPETSGKNSPTEKG